MRATRQSYWSILLMFIFVSLASSQTTGKHSLNVPVDLSTVVRFFYLPPQSYWHPPLTFRVVSNENPRLGTAPMAKPYDRTPYISLSDMQSFIRGLSRLNLSWHGSNKVQKPEKIPPGEMTNKMEITVFSTAGTYRAFLDPRKICKTLAPLDAALKESRARWEFQLFRINYGCTVYGFNRDAYMQHYEGGESPE